MRIESVVRSWAHPRSRGENRLRLQPGALRAGSSPLTRGKLAPYKAQTKQARLIPAHAGKTRSIAGAAGFAQAHPRSRGENRLEIEQTVRAAGSSPLTRGKRVRVISGRLVSRLIPAHAGKTLPDLRFYCADRSDLGNP